MPINTTDMPTEVQEAFIAAAIDALDAGWQPLFQRDITAPCYACGEVARVVSKDDDRWTMTILDHAADCLHVKAEDRWLDDIPHFHHRNGGY
jgi:hypothetical protein